MILSDFFLSGAWGLIMPIMAIFIADKIQGGDVGVAGIAIGIYWILKSVIQIPISNWLDKGLGEKDDYNVMVFGLFLASLTPIGFIFSSQPWHVYVLQIVHALAMALVVPAWSGIFTRHMDSGKEAESWAMDSSALGVSTGIAGIVGGILAESFGFTVIFFGVSISGMIAVSLLFLIKKDIITGGIISGKVPILHK